MRIRIIKKSGRNTLICTRPDGSYTKAEVGPVLPHHDLAHYVAERQLSLKNGFYGAIATGRSIEELSDKEVIKTLGAESWFAEIVTRALQSHSSGACTTEQFISLVREEMETFRLSVEYQLDEHAILQMADSFKQLLGQWNALPDGESLELVWP